MSEVSKNELLMHALLDGELDEVRAQEVRKTLTTDPQLGRLYDVCLAQRESLSAMPSFTLPDSFSRRVLQAAEAATLAPQFDGRATELLSPATATARSGLSMWQIATTAIFSSAATLLISMFLLPTDWADHAPVVADRLVGMHSPKADVEPAVAIGTEYADPLPADHSMVAAALTEPAIEQVWLLEAQNNQSGVKLARALAANSIQVPAELSGERDDELIDTLDQGINGILIEASAIQMKKALLELADSEQFEISAFTLPGHEAYFADIRQAKNAGSDQPEVATEDDADVVVSADQLAAEAMADAANRFDGKLVQPPITMAQQLRQRRFSKKKTPAKASTSDRKKNLFADGLYSGADGPEGLGGSAAPLFGSDELPAVDEIPAMKQNVEDLFPENQQSADPKGNYLLLIRSASQ